MNLSRYAYIFVLLSLLGCTFSPTDEYFKDIKKVNLNDPNYSINLENYPSGDTIYLYNSPDFKYSVRVASGNLLSVDVTLGKSQVYSSTQYTGSFNLRDNLATGIFPLKIQYRATTGTGSLADVNGNEQVQVWKEWILKVDIDPPPPPTIQSSIVNGFLKFTWDKYSKPNFIAYHLYYNRTGAQISKTIKDPTKNFLIDSSYVGNESATLQVYTEGYKEGQSSSQSKKTPLGLYSVKYDQTDSVATLSWMKSPYSNAFKQCELYVDGKLQQTFSNLADTVYSFKVNAIYGYTNQLELRYSVKYLHAPFSAYESFSASLSNTVATKKLGRPWSYFYFNKGSNSIMAINDTQTGKLIYRFDTNLALLDSLTLNIGPRALLLPYSGTSVYYSKGVSGYFYSQDILTKQESATPVSIVGTGPSVQAASGNGMLCYTYSYPSSTAGYTQIQDVIFNVNTNTYLYPAARTVTTVSRQTDAMTMSDDAKSFTINGTYFNLNGSTITKIGTLNTGSILGYRPDVPSEILVQQLLLDGSNSLAIYDASDLSLKRTIQPPGNYKYYCYDPVTKQALFQNYDKSVYLIDVDTKQMREVKVYYTKLGAFIGGYLISSNGDYIKL